MCDPASGSRGGSTARPPRGLRPRFVSEVPRALEILEACWRYMEVSKQVPADWLEELREINSHFLP